MEFFAEEQVEYLEQLQAQSFAAMVYWIFIIGVIMILVCLLERTYRINKRWTIALLFCPPLILIFIKKYWDETKGLCCFFAGFYLVIIFTGSLSGYHMTAFTTNILLKIFLWPIVFGKWLITHNILKNFAYFI